MPEIKLTADSSDHEDTEGDRPVIVLLHGLLITGPLWNEVADSPTVPGGLGAALKPRRLKAL